MTGPDDSSIRFPCPRCFLRLKAPLAQAGTKRRCPKCQWVFEVPAETKVAAPREVYPLWEGAEPSPAADQAYIAVACPLCNTLIHATADQVGQQTVCPDCQTPVVVRRPAEVDQKKGRPAAAIEGYPLCEEVDESAFGSRAADQTYVPVTCPVCRTFMQVTEDRVGEEIVCPDCLMPMVVRPPAEAKAEKSPLASQLGEYPLCEEADDSRWGVRPADQTYFPARCPLCNTLMQATEDQVGREMVCPDCRMSFVVPPPPAPKRKRDLRKEAGKAYGVGASIESPEYTPLIGTAWSRPRPSMTDAEGSGLVFTPPRWPFLSGIMNFPLYTNSWSRWLMLSLWATVVLCLAIGTLALTGQRDPVSWFLNMLLFVATFSLGIMWTTVASVYLLVILLDTAYGYDEVENWPSGPFTDWIGDSLFVFSSVLLSALPVVGLAKVLDSAGLRIEFCFPAIFLVLFPVVLLSMLETNSPLNPLSMPVWRSLFTRWWVWGLFYIETTALLALVGWLSLLTLTYVPILGTVLAIPVAVATLMIYFRLLGRLAWCCADDSARGEPRPVEAERSKDEEDG